LNTTKLMVKMAELTPRAAWRGHGPRAGRWGYIPVWCREMGRQGREGCFSTNQLLAPREAVLTFQGAPTLLGPAVRGGPAAPASWGRCELAASPPRPAQRRWQYPPVSPLAPHAHPASFTSKQHRLGSTDRPLTSGSAPACPTKTVSTMERRGSAASATIAGRASEKMALSWGLLRTAEASACHQGEAPDWAAPCLLAAALLSAVWQQGRTRCTPLVATTSASASAGRVRRQAATVSSCREA
jgi:hypothetical protein